MKNLLTISLLILSTNIMAEESVLVCKDVKCAKVPTLVVKETTHKKDLKMTDMHFDDCLVNLKENKVYKITEIDLKTNKVVTVLEAGDELKREVEWFDEAKFDRSRRVMDCADTDSRILSDRKKTAECLESGGKYSETYFCETEVRK